MHWWTTRTQGCGHTTIDISVCPRLGLPPLGCMATCETLWCVIWIIPKHTICGIYVCTCVCVCVLGIQSRGISFLFDLVTYHCGGNLFYGWIPLPPSGIPITPRIWVPDVLSYNKYVCNEAGDKIIHAYVQLLSNKTLNIKLWLIWKWKKDRQLNGKKISRRAYLASLATRGRNFP